MMKTLEELYYGNINQYDRCIRCIRRSCEFDNLLKLVTRNEEELNEGLTEAQKETFENFKVCEIKMQPITELEASMSGFKIGARIIIEVMSTAEEDEGQAL